MINTIASTTADPYGFAMLPVLPDTMHGETKRRVSRVATLDGDVVINDAGYSDGDRTLEITWPARDRALEEVVDRIVQLYNRVTVSTRAGCYLASPEAYVPGAKESSLRLLVIEKLSA